MGGCGDGDLGLLVVAIVAAMMVPVYWRYAMKAQNIAFTSAFLN
jgi:Tfp pilus assembly major pilin PilA